MTRNLFWMSGAAMALALSATSGFAAGTSDDFVKKAVQGDASEIMLGHLAEQKGGSQQVRDFGKMLVTDHTTAKEEVSEIAKSMNVSVSDDATSDAKDEQDKLSKLSGGDFDKAFGTYMVADHTKDIREFQDQAKADDGPVSSLAAKQLPVLQKHLQMAQAIAGSAGKTAAAIGNAPSHENAGQWRASKLAGVSIYGPDNKTVGKISDVLLNRDGKAEYVVIGVGGFLGIGEKDVAIPFDKVKFTNQSITPPANPAPANSTMTTAKPNAMGASSTTGTPTAAPAADGMAMGNPAGSISTGDAGRRSMGYPDHGTIDMTAAQLKAAPDFHFEG